MNVDQPQLELQLKVWKELAISKQMLMKTATDALKLDPACSPNELKDAIERFIAKIAQADADAANAQENAKHSIAAMEKKLEVSAKAQAAAEALAADLQKKQELAREQMAHERASAAKEMQKLKERLAEKEKALKAINTALADTPEGVLKKMNALKKEKQKEADDRRQVEASLATLRKDKQQQDQKLTFLQTSSAKLITQHRDVHAVALQLQERAKTLAPEATDLPVLPELDTKLIEEIEAGEAKKEEKDSKKK